MRGGVSGGVSGSIFRGNDMSAFSRLTSGHIVAFTTLVPMLFPGLADRKVAYARDFSFSPSPRVMLTALMTPTPIFDPPVVFGDLNCDGQLTRDDIAAFIAALQDPEAWQTQFGRS